MIDLLTANREIFSVVFSNSVWVFVCLQYFVDMGFALFYYTITFWIYHVYHMFCMVFGWFAYEYSNVFSDIDYLHNKLDFVFIFLGNEPIALQVSVLWCTWLCSNVFTDARFVRGMCVDTFFERKQIPFRIRLVSKYNSLTSIIKCGKYTYMPHTDMLYVRWHFRPFPKHG